MSEEEYCELCGGEITDFVEPVCCMHCENWGCSSCMINVSDGYLCPLCDEEDDD